MKFKRIALLACLTGAIPGAALASVYRYADYAVPEDFQTGVAYFSIDTSTGRYDTGDSGDAVTFCGKNEPLYCFRTPSLSFGVPKGPLMANQEWDFDRRRFHVLKKTKLALLGSARDVWVIVSADQGRSHAFYYSEEHGLLAIKYVGDHGRDIHLFVLAGANGFPR